MTTTVDIPLQRAEVLSTADVVVAGGGPAGLAAAVTAARRGAGVVLLENYGFFGGNLTAASVGTICGLYMRTSSGGFEPLVGGFGAEMAARLRDGSAGMGPVPFKETAVFLYVPWAVKRIADHLVSDTPGITAFLHARVTGVVREGSRITHAIVATKSGPVAIAGDVFVDATGDADVAVAAGVPAELGPPDRRQFASMQFFLEGADAARALPAIGQLGALIEEHGAHLSRSSGALIPTMRPGEFLGAMTRVRRPDGGALDPTDLADLTYGEIEGRRVAEEAAAFVKEHVAGFEQAFLFDTAAQLGIREGRRVSGRTTLTGDDVTAGARFDDAVAACAWPQEYHTRGRETDYLFLPPDTYYQIPLRALLVDTIDNLVVAGRCISADHDALASVRVMGPAMALGQAAGTAAQMATAECRGDLGKVDPSALRDELVAAGQIL
jgi:hypothetical protein